MGGSGNYVIKVMEIVIGLFGDWRRVQIALTNLPRMVMTSAAWGQRNVAEKLVKIVKGHINNQDLGWSPRVSTTNSNDPRILVDYGDYYGAIKAYSDKGIYYAGVKRDAFNRSGTRIADYAVVHEYGWESIPRRPLWGPSFKELGGSKGIKETVTQAIYAKIKSLRAQGLDVDFTL